VTMPRSLLKNHPTAEQVPSSSAPRIMTVADPRFKASVSVFPHESYSKAIGH